MYMREAATRRTVASQTPTPPSPNEDHRNTGTAIVVSPYQFLRRATSTPRITHAVSILGDSDRLDWPNFGPVETLRLRFDDIHAPAVVVMGPIAAILARNLGFMPDAFLMAVALGASCDFLTPIGHQNNMLVMGPGGYRFGDYWRLGLPLSCIVVAIGTPLILFAWPLQ